MKQYTDEEFAKVQVGDLLNAAFWRQVEQAEESQRKHDAISDGGTRFPYRKFAELKRKS